MRTLWYMRDNHTFRELPNDAEAALDALREEFSHRSNYGMLCVTGEGRDEISNEHAGATFDEFLPRASAWLDKAINYKTPGDLEYESWPAPVGAEPPDRPANSPMR